MPLSCFAVDLDRDRLLGIGRSEREALGRTVQYTPPELWEAESPCEGWRVKDVLAHVAAAEVAAATIAGDEAPSEVEEYRKALEAGPFVVDEWNRWSVDRRRDVSPVSLGLEWGRAADLLLARVAAGGAEDWASKEVPWVAGDIRLRYLVQTRMAEWWVHGEDIREGGRLPPRREHWPIYVVNDLAIRLIPYSLSLADRDIRGKTVEIQLKGVGEGLWRRRTDPSEEPAGKPDAYITGDGYAFASVAGGRADVDVCLYEGLLNTGGEAEVAEAVLRTLRSFP
jgi:uncharacterized protein (TIGR03083 family)